MTGERAAKHKEALKGLVEEAEGDAERAGRWRMMTKGTHGKGRRKEGSRNGEDEKTRTRTERQTTRRRAN